MAAEQLRIYARPDLAGSALVLGLGGWMNGGEVSQGTVKLLARAVGAARLAEIAPEDFYIYNMPGSMEISALFRPHTVIQDGLVKQFKPPRNVFQYDDVNRLVLFRGKEPHLNWSGFAECVFALARTFGVERVFFVGSYAGVVPHTRDPRIYGSVSDPSLKSELEPHGVRFSNYEGPAGFSTYLTTLAPKHGLPMATIVAEIPAYVQGTNPRSIEAVTRFLGALLGLSVDLDELRSASDGFEARVNQAVAERPELQEMVRKMESDYDSELFETQMTDLKAWLEQRGIRLD